MTEPLSATTGTLEHVNPNDLMIELNVRTEAGLTKQFIESIRENGVLVPVVAVRAPDGILYVRAGQRRTLAAREAGLASIPVYVTDADVDTGTRLSQQIVENDHRMALRGDERVAGIQAMLDTGLSATKVAKKLSISAERVKQSKAVAGSAVAMSALSERQVSLAEAAAIAEFEGDEDVVDRLLAAAGRGYFEAEVARQRQIREEEAARMAAADAWKAKGYQVLDSYPGYDSGLVPLGHLLKDGKSLDDESIAEANPTVWAVILSEVESFLDAEGNPVDESLIDWNTEDNPDAVPAEGMVSAVGIVETEEYLPSGYFCSNPEAAGLTVSDRWSKLAAASAATGGGEVQTSQDLEAKSKAKAERKRVITLNKAGDAAETARREFVKGMLKRKTTPKGAMVFIADQLASNGGALLGSHRGDEIAGDLLGAGVRDGALLDHATDSRAEVVLLGLTLGALESWTPRSTWRGPTAESKAYLRFLAENGYGLSPVEQVITGDMTAEAAMEALA